VAKDGGLSLGCHAQNVAGWRKSSYPIDVCRSLQVVVQQPKVIGIIVFMDFFPLNFQICLNKVIFLGVIT
jgi:hypothetical protein